MAKLLKDAGLPDGVFNVVHGDKESVNALLVHPGIKSISFVGSTPIARYVYETGTKSGKRVQALGGAKNHMVVLPDADLDLAADAAINAGFGSAGERCMAISALVAVGPIADELVGKIKSRMASLKVGDGTQGADMGPLVTQIHRDKVSGYVAAGEKEGATVVVDGRDISVAGDGFWLGPTLFDNVTPDMSIYKEEIFGPVLSVIRVETYDEALTLVNDHPYGMELPYSPMTVAQLADSKMKLKLAWSESTFQFQCRWLITHSVDGKILSLEIRMPMALKECTSSLVEK